MHTNHLLSGNRVPLSALGVSAAPLSSRPLAPCLNSAARQVSATCSAIPSRSASPCPSPDFLPRSLCPAPAARSPRSLAPIQARLPQRTPDIFPASALRPSPSPLAHVPAPASPTPPPAHSPDHIPIRPVRPVSSLDLPLASPASPANLSPMPLLRPHLHHTPSLTSLEATTPHPPSLCKARLAPTSTPPPTPLSLVPTMPLHNATMAPPSPCKANAILLTALLTAESSATPLRHHLAKALP
jgi:hypothetical protein